MSTRVVSLLCLVTAVAASVEDEPRRTGHLYPKPRKGRNGRSLQEQENDAPLPEMFSPEYWAELEESEAVGSIADQFVPYEQTVDDFTLICEGEVTMMNLDCPEDACDSNVSAEKGCERCKATFCQLDFDLQKNHPERYPTIIDLVGASEHCDSAPITVDFHETVQRCRAYDEARPRAQTLPLKVPLQGLVTEAGGTDALLVVNAVVKDSVSHRVVSAPQPVTEAATMCNDYRKRRRRTHLQKNDKACDADRAAALLRDVVDLLLRTRDARETRAVVATDAAFSKNGGLEIFARAFPDAPWVFYYDDPAAAVGAQMGRFKKERAACVSDRKDPPPNVLRVVADVDPVLDAKGLDVEDYCAASLAAAADDALRASAVADGKGTLVASDDALATLGDVLERFGMGGRDDETNNVLAERTKGPGDIVLLGLVDEKGRLDLELQQKLKQKRLDKTTPELKRASDRFYGPVFSRMETTKPDLVKNHAEYHGEVPMP